MIKVIVKGKDDEVRTRVKVNCKSTKRLLSETVAAVVAVCKVAQEHNEKMTLEMIMEAAKDVLEGKNALLREAKPNENE